MRRRILLAAVVAGAFAAPATSAAQDRVVAHDRYGIVAGQALGATIVYQRAVPRRLRAHRSLYMRVIGGHRSAVHLPKNAYRGVETIGRDQRGRVVLPFVRETRRPGGYLVDPHWWLYDVASDTIRPLRGLPAGTCTP